MAKRTTASTTLLETKCQKVEFESCNGIWYTWLPLYFIFLLFRLPYVSIKSYRLIGLYARVYWTKTNSNKYPKSIEKKWNGWQKCSINFCRLYEISEHGMDGRTTVYHIDVERVCCALHCCFVWKWKKCWMVYDFIFVVCVSGLTWMLAAEW